MNLTFIKSNFQNKDFVNLVSKLDLDLAIRDGDEHDFYHQFNGIEQLNYVILVYLDDVPVACGAIKPYRKNIAEVKRMFVIKEFRGRRIATKLLLKLENWAKSLSFTQLILETGIRNTEAIAVYKRCGYSVISNFDQYEGMENSVCFAKALV